MLLKKMLKILLQNIFLLDGKLPTNLLISGKSSSKILFAETEETVSESVFSSETISFLEIVRAAGALVVVRVVGVLVEVP